MTKPDAVENVESGPLTMRVQVDGVERQRQVYYSGLELLPETSEGEQLVRCIGAAPFIVTVRR